MERKKINESRTRLALLATMSDLHYEPVNYDLDRLRAIVTNLAPDLLCAEITREMWEGEDLSQAAGEVREALVPVVEATDVVLVPVAPNSDRFADFAPEFGWRVVWWQLPAYLKKFPQPASANTVNPWRG